MSRNSGNARMHSCNSDCKYPECPHVPKPMPKPTARMSTGGHICPKDGPCRWCTKKDVVKHIDMTTSAPVAIYASGQTKVLAVDSREASEQDFSAEVEKGRKIMLRAAHDEIVEAEAKKRDAAAQKEAAKAAKKLIKAGEHICEPTVCNPFNCKTVGDKPDFDAIARRFDIAEDDIEEDLPTPPLEVPKPKDRKREREEAMASEFTELHKRVFQLEEEVDELKSVLNRKNAMLADFDALLEKAHKAIKLQHAYIRDLKNMLD